MVDLGKKIMIVGSGGSGKSTLSKIIGTATGTPVIHLDKHFWNPGWVITPLDEWIPRQTALLSGDRWIADGNYGGTMELRLERADTVIFLDFNRYICLFRVLKRVAATIGKIREDMADGCPEKFDFGFLRWIWNFPANERPVVVEKLKQYDKNVIVLRNPKEAAGFVKLCK